MLKSQPRNIKGTKKREMCCLMNHSLSSDSPHPHIFLTSQSSPVEPIYILFRFSIVISEKECTYCILVKLEALTVFLNKYFEASFCILLVCFYNDS